MLLFEHLTMLDIYVAFIITYLYSVAQETLSCSVFQGFNFQAVVSEPSYKKPCKFLSYSYNYRKLSF